MAKIIVQIIVAGSQVLGRAFARALRQEIEASQQAARARGAPGTRESRTERGGITLEEAKQILNVTDLNKEKVNEQFQKLFEANEPAKGGSFYLQSKVFRAKERIDLELQEFEKNKKKGPDTGGGGSADTK